MQQYTVYKLSYQVCFTERLCGALEYPAQSRNSVCVCVCVTVYVCVSAPAAKRQTHALSLSH